jgi:hypothetical protein
VLVTSGNVARGVSGPALVRVVDNPTATPVVFTRDESKAGATFVHEEVSEAMFDEINNVIDANRILSKGQRRFFLVPQAYFRIYAERHRVKQDQAEIANLFHAGACEFYAPNLFWTSKMSDELIAGAFETIYLSPKSPQIHWLCGPPFSSATSFAAGFTTGGTGSGTATHSRRHFISLSTRL